jgi:hypothetical protein
MRQARFAQFTRVRVHARNLLQARMIITPIISMFGSFPPSLWLVCASKVYLAWEPTLFMESLRSKSRPARILSVNAVLAN